MNVIYRIWTWWLFFLQTVSGSFILKLSSDHSGLIHLPFFPSRILLVTWPSWYLCFHFSFIRTRVKNFFLCASFLNNNNLTHFLETGNRLWGDQWWRVPKPETFSPLNYVPEWLACWPWRPGMKEASLWPAQARLQGLASTTLALAFSQSSGLMKIMCLRVFGIIS